MITKTQLTRNIPFKGLIAMILVSMAFGELINVDASALPSTVNAVSQFSFVLYPSNRILNTDYIVISFPQKIIVTNGNRNCIASSASDSTLVIKSCTASSNLITATIQSTLLTTSDFVVKLQINDGLKNPPSAISDPFVVKIYSEANAVKDYNDLLEAQFSPGILNNVELKSSSNQSGSIANLAIKFTPGQPILKGGIIEIDLPLFNSNSGTSETISLIPGNPATTLNIISGIDPNSSIIVSSRSIILGNVFPNANSDTVTQISFEIKNILNPSSTMPLYGYSIITKDSLNSGIETSKNLFLQVGLPSTVNTFSITSSNTLVNQMTTLNFVFKTNQYIPQGAILELIFPNDIPISQLTLNSITGISKIEPVVNYSINGQAITMTNAISKYYTSFDIHYFKVSSIQNQSSTKASGDFKFNVYTVDNYIMYSLLFSVTYTPTPGEFSNIVINQTTTEINQVNTYSFAFINKDTILAGSTLVITLPPELSVGNFAKSQCKGTLTGLSPNSQCEVVSSSTLKIYDAFPANLLSFSQISFQLPSVKNYSCCRASSSFSLASYTSENHSIDVSNSNILVSFSEGELTQAIITPNLRTNYEITEYVFSLKIKNSLSPYSQIVIKFPTEIIITNIPANNILNCSVIISSSGSTSSNICYNNSSSNTEVLIKNMNSNFTISSGDTILITVPNIQNSRSLKPSSSFSIYTRTSEECNIDRNYADLVITNTLANRIDRLEIVPSSFKTNEITNYTFTIYPHTQIISGDILSITFPPQITLPTDSASLIVSGISNLSVALTSSVSVLNNISTVKIVLSIPGKACNCIFQGEFISLSIRNLKNPQSVKPTDSFTVSFMTNDKYPIEQYLPNFTLTMTTPNILQDTNIRPLISHMNQVSDYIIEFSPFDSIPKDSVVLIKYPQEISVVDGTCSGLMNIDIQASCTNNLATRTITLANAFPSDQDKKKIQLQINGLESQIPNGAISTGTFQLILQTNDGFPVDQKLDGLSVVFSCQFPCDTCLNDQVTCTKCIITSGSQFLLNGKCYATCPDGYTQDSNSNTCIKCNPLCKTCENTNKDNCITCPQTNPYYISSLLTCTGKCPDGMYLGQNNICTPCQSTCKTCSDTPDHCLSCPEKDKTIFYLLYNSNCVAECPSNSIKAEGNVCLPCNSNCKSCEGGINNCTSCYTNTSPPNVLYKGKCINQAECSSNMNLYAEISSGKCLECNQGCKICGNGPTKCKECSDGYIMESENNCVRPYAQCPPGFFVNSNLLCSKCNSDNCLTCVTNENLCTSCNSGKLLQMNTCVDKCKEGFYRKFANGVYECGSCMESCRTCIDRNSCSSCKTEENKILYKDQCVSLDECPVTDGYYIDENRTFCAQCDIPYCKNCASSRCIQCQNGYFNFEGSCLGKCPHGYTQDISTSFCIKSTEKIERLMRNMKYNYKFQLPKDYLAFFFTCILILFYAVLIKYHHLETFFLGSSISMVSVIFTFHIGLLIYYAYEAGNTIYFIVLIYIFIAHYFINCLFLVIYGYYTNSDDEFIYWKSSRKCISFLFITVCSIVDYKIIRLLYSRFNKIKLLSAMFKDFRKIHSPYKMLILTDMIFLSVPLMVVSILILATYKIYSTLFYLALENILINVILLILMISELILVQDVNLDYYHQKKGMPDVIPFAVFADRSPTGAYGISTYFDFNEPTPKDLISSNDNSQNKDKLQISSSIIKKVVSTTSLTNLKEDKDTTKLSGIFESQSTINLNPVKRNLFNVPKKNDSSILQVVKVPVKSDAVACDSPSKKHISLGNAMIHNLSFGMKNLLSRSKKKSPYQKISNEEDANIRPFKEDDHDTPTPNFHNEQAGEKKDRARGDM